MEREYMMESGMNREEVKKSLVDALKEVKPLVKGDRPAKDNANEKLELWKSWAENADK